MRKSLCAALIAGLAMEAGAAILMARLPGLPTTAQIGAAIVVPILTAMWTAIIGIALELRRAGGEERVWRAGLQPAAMTGVAMVMSVVLLLRTSMEPISVSELVWVIAMGITSMICAGAIGAGRAQWRRLHPEKSTRDFARPVFLVFLALLFAQVLFSMMWFYGTRAIATGILPFLAVFGIGLAVMEAVKKYRWRLNRR